MRVPTSVPRSAQTLGGLTTNYVGVDRMSKRTCSFPECTKPHKGRGFCGGHYRQLSAGLPLTVLKSQGTGTPSERFWSKVDKSGECWLWTASLAGTGYPSFSVKGRTVRGNRFAYEEAYGPIPEGLVIDHTCWNTLCVRPTHLRAITNQQNLQNRKGADRTSSTGIRGVYRRASGWQVFGSTGGKQVYVGTFTDIKEAEDAAVAFRREHMPYSLKDQMYRMRLEAT